MLIFSVSDTSFWAHSWHTVGFADQTAQISRSEKTSQTLYLRLFINVKIYHPSRPTVLKAVCDQENPTTLSTCPRAVLKRETQALGLSPSRLAALLPKTARRNLQTSGCASWLKIHSNRGGILVSLISPVQINPITEQVRKYYQEMNLSEVICASGKT